MTVVLHQSGNVFLTLRLNRSLPGQLFKHNSVLASYKSHKIWKILSFRPHGSWIVFSFWIIAWLHDLHNRKCSSSNVHPQWRMLYYSAVRVKSKDVNYTEQINGHLPFNIQDIDTVYLWRYWMFFWTVNLPLFLSFLSCSSCKILRFLFFSNKSKYSFVPPATLRQTVQWCRSMFVLLPWVYCAVTAQEHFQWWPSSGWAIKKNAHLKRERERGRKSKGSLRLLSITSILWKSCIRFPHVIIICI